MWVDVSKIIVYSSSDVKKSRLQKCFTWEEGLSEVKSLKDINVEVPSSVKSRDLRAGSLARTQQIDLSERTWLHRRYFSFVLCFTTLSVTNAIKRLVRMIGVLWIGKDLEGTGRLQ